MSRIHRRLQNALAARRARSERGAFTAMIVILIVMLFVVAGMVIDGGLAINARARTLDDLEQAARRGANQIDEGALRANGRVVVVESRARAEAAAFLQQRSDNYGSNYRNITVNVVPGTNEVIVSAEREVDTSLLQLIGIGSIPVSGQASAVPQIGIDGPFG